MRQVRPLINYNQACLSSSVASGGGSGAPTAMLGSYLGSLGNRRVRSSSRGFPAESKSCFVIQQLRTQDSGGWTL